MNELSATYWPLAYDTGNARDWMRARIMAAATDPCAHDYGQQPGADGRIYMVCRKCGHSFAAGG
jgi:hypothetical protein